MTSVCVRNIGQLVTCDPSLGPAPGVIEGGAIVMTDAALTFVGRESDLDRSLLHDDTDTIDADGHAVIPGFVDSHTHLVWMGERSDEYALRAEGVSYEVIASRGGGIAGTVRATRAASVDALSAAARVRARRMLEHGTTTVEIKSGYGLDHDAEMRQLDAVRSLAAQPALPAVVATYLPLHAAPTGDRATFLDEVCSRGLAEAAQRSRIVDAFCEVGAYTVDECRSLFTAATSGWPSTISYKKTTAASCTARSSITRRICSTGRLRSAHQS